MAGDLQVPTVTEEELLAFHAWRYGRLYISTLSTFANHGNIAHVEDITEDDDGLGWYPDGVKRTLTDEQVAMFRHSEIQAIVRARRHQKEMKSSESEATSDGEQDIKKFDQEPNMLPSSLIDSSRHEPLEDVEDGEIDEEDDEEEYARFLEKERLEFESVALSMKAKKGRETFNNTGRTTSTRRRVRELDETTGGNEVLDYGDEPIALPNPIKASSVGLNPSNGGQTMSAYEYHRTDKSNCANTHSKTAAVIGRKIWWPTIGS